MITVCIGTSGYQKSFDSEQIAIDFFGVSEYNAIKNGNHPEYFIL